MLLTQEKFARCYCKFKPSYQNTLYICYACVIMINPWKSHVGFFKLYVCPWLCIQYMRSTVELSCIHSSKEIVHSTRFLQGLKWDQRIFFGKKDHKSCALKRFTPGETLFVCSLCWMFNWYLVLNPITQTE